MQFLPVLYTLVSTMWMGWATNGPGYELIMLLARLDGCVSHFNLSFSDPMPQAWGHGAQLRSCCGEGSDDRPSSLDRDGSIRGSRLIIACLQISATFSAPPNGGHSGKALESILSAAERDDTWHRSVTQSKIQTVPLKASGRPGALETSRSRYSPVGASQVRYCSTRHVPLPLSDSRQ